MKKSRKNRFLGILLSLAMVLGLMPGVSLTAFADEDTITWDSSNVLNEGNEDNEVYNGESRNFEGITISCIGPSYSFFRPYSSDIQILCYGDDGDSFTFTAPEGKQFCRIEINGEIWNFENYGSWEESENYDAIVWNGTPADTVTLGTVYTVVSAIDSIVFYFGNTGEDEPESLYTFDATSTSDQKVKWEYMISGVDATRITKIEALIDMESLADWGQVVWYDNDDDNKRHSVGIDGTPGIRKYTVEGETIPEADAAIIQIVGKAKLLGYAVYYGDTLAKKDGVLQVTRTLSDNVYAQTANVNNVDYTRYVYVLPREELKGKNEALFTVKKGEAEGTFSTSTYYTGMICNEFIYEPASKNSVMLICVVKGGKPEKDGGDLTCTLSIDGTVYEPNA